MMIHNHSPFQSTVLAGLKWPIPTASACVVWSVARLFYTRGYITGFPEKVIPFFFHLPSSPGALMDAYVHSEDRVAFPRTRLAQVWMPLSFRVVKINVGSFVLTGLLIASTYVAVSLVLPKP
jgi:hypothetical protein